MVIRTIATFACPVYRNIAEYHIKRLQIMQNKILKMILNVSWLTSTKNINKETEVLKIKDYIAELTLKYDQRNAFN